MTGVPIWLAALIAVGSPLVAVTGLLIGRRADRETETRWRREETMRLLRWAGDHAVDAAQERRRLGVAALRSLGRSPLLQASDQRLVADVLDGTMRSDRPHRGSGGA